MKLNKLFLDDKKLFSRFLNARSHELSAYAFENIYIWKALFDIQWAMIEDSLCIFFRDKAGCFMYLPPLSEHPGVRAVKESFAVMNGINKNKEISRIENAEEKDLPFYEKIGYGYKKRGCEYLCRQKDMAGLKGDKFKSKRASLNYFTKNYRFEYMLHSSKYEDECLRLYSEWAKNRRGKNTDSIYRGMIDDSYLCLETLLGSYGDLEIEGRVVRVDGKLKGFTAGFRLNKDIFCVLYEITDLSVKGISQFIFQKFSSELTDYKYINIMDDSGLDNLKKVKLSYHPAKLIPAYIVKEKF